MSVEKLDDLDAEISEAQKRFRNLVAEFKHEGFTESQAVYLINLLNDYIPLV